MEFKILKCLTFIFLSSFFLIIVECALLGNVEDMLTKDIVGQGIIARMKEKEDGPDKESSISLPKQEPVKLRRRDEEEGDTGTVSVLDTVSDDGSDDVDDDPPKKKKQRKQQKKKNGTVSTQNKPILIKTNGQKETTLKIRPVESVETIKMQPPQSALKNTQKVEKEAGKISIAKSKAKQSTPSSYSYEDELPAAKVNQKSSGKKDSKPEMKEYVKVNDQWSPNDEAEESPPKSDTKFPKKRPTTTTTTTSKPKPKKKQSEEFVEYEVSQVGSNKRSDKNPKGGMKEYVKVNDQWIPNVEVEDSSSNSDRKSPKTKPPTTTTASKPKSKKKSPEGFVEYEVSQVDSNKRSDKNPKGGMNEYVKVNDQWIPNVEVEDSSSNSDRKSSKTKPPTTTTASKPKSKKKSSEEFVEYEVAQVGSNKRSDRKGTGSKQDSKTKKLVDVDSRLGPRVGVDDRPSSQGKKANENTKSNKISLLGLGSPEYSEESKDDDGLRSSKSGKGSNDKNSQASSSAKKVQKAASKEAFIIEDDGDGDGNIHSSSHTHTSTHS